MITAEEARNLVSQEKIKERLDAYNLLCENRLLEIFKLIKEASLDGRYEINIRPYAVNISALERLGYNCILSEDSVKISWENRN